MCFQWNCTTRGQTGSGIFEKRHRYDFNIYFKSSIKRLSISYRSRVQSRYSGLYSSDFGSVPSNYWRNKINLQYNLKGKLKKLTPSLSSELFYPLNGQVQNYPDAYRVRISAQYKIKKRRYLKLFYMLEQEINKKNTLSAYIIGVGFNYQFKNKKKTDKSKKNKD